MFAAAGLFVGGLGVPSAMAADLGGDCCADLEERVAELEATTARKGNRRMSLTVSGQVNTALMYWSDDNKGNAAIAGTKPNGSDLYVVDNAVSGSGIQFNGTARINPNLTAGFDLAISIDTGARSHQVTQFSDDGSSSGGISAVGDSTIVMTRANWFLDHKQLGKVSVGRINFESAGASNVDLGGAGVVANSNIGYWQRSFRAVADDGTILGATATWDALMGGGPVNGSGLARGNAISYRTPTFGGFSIGATWGENDIWDVAARYAGEFSGFRLAAAAA
jgi:hypothetical protein